MKKKILFFCIFFLFKSNLFGFGGAYVGGSIGGNVIRGSQHGNAVGTLALNTYPLDLSADLFSTDVSGVLFAGFGGYWKIFYSAVEVFGEYSHNKLSVSRQNITLLPLDFASESVYDETHVIPNQIEELAKERLTT